MFPFFKFPRPSRKNSQSIARCKRLLNFQPLESRAMMAGIPQLSSLPGAAQTIYLDFDGDTQQTWKRTDANQTYTNVVAGEFNIDNLAGISDAEEAAIRKIWETVADDYAPFNVNVTTVAPASFADRVALRVVMSGDTSATLKTSAGKTFSSGTRNVFISDDQGNMVDTSGYAAIGSYTNAEPNVVYVFAKYMSTWSTTDSEGRYRDLRAIIANTASHEAGHAFGLEHHGNYDVGTNVTTPIMGSNTQGDRTIWSSYTVGTTAFDSVSRLSTLFGARADDYSDSIGSKVREFTLNYDKIYGLRGSANGVISTTRDTDLFRLTTTATNTYQITVTVPQFGNLDSQLVLYSIRKSTFLGLESLTQISVTDPAISVYAPFSGLGATLKTTLGAGSWAIGVRSHGGYGDIGNYTLNVSLPSSSIYGDIGGALITTSTTTATTTTTKTSLSTTSINDTTKSGGAGRSVDLSPGVLEIRSTAIMPTAVESKSNKRVDVELLDQIFARWPAELQPEVFSATKPLKR